MISVIIPVFNSRETIARALDSIFSQTYKDVEVIIVDDGSSDNTHEVVKNYGNKVKYQYQENSGPAVARNKALQMAQGEWIAFLDSDDVWLPEKLEKQAALVDKNPQLKWCCTNRYQSDGKRRSEFGKTSKICSALAGRDYFDSYFAAAAKGLCPIITTCLMVKKSVFDELGNFDKGYLRGQDLDMWWRIAHKYPQIGYIVEPLAVRYLDDENPVTKKRRLEAMNGQIGLKLLESHLKMADNTDFEKDFIVFSTSQLKQWLIVMIFCGYSLEAYSALKEFGELLPAYWHIFLKISSLSPKVMSGIMKSIYKIIFSLKLTKKINRSHK